MNQLCGISITRLKSWLKRSLHFDIFLNMSSIIILKNVILDASKSSICLQSWNYTSSILISVLPVESLFQCFISIMTSVFHSSLHLLNFTSIFISVSLFKSSFPNSWSNYDSSSFVMLGLIFTLFTFLESWDNSRSFELWTGSVGLV